VPNGPSIIGSPKLQKDIYIESLRGRTNAVKPVYKGHLKEPENVPFISRCPFKYRVRLYALFSKWKK
jgi:hypothetical protein